LSVRSLLKGITVNFNKFSFPLNTCTGYNFVL